MGLGKMMDFTLMFIVTITLVLLNFSPSAYSDTYVDLTAILSAPGSPFRSFLTLIQTENVIQILEQQGNGEPGLTLFVPNNDAIARDNVPWGTLSLAGVQALLLFHAIPQYISATAISLSALSKISPVLTMAGVQSNTLSGFNLNFTYASVSDTLYLNSGWTQVKVLGTKNITFFPTEIYEIDKVLMPEGIFGTNIPPPPSTSASSAPSASTTSTPHKNKTGNSPPLKSRTGLSGGVIAGISAGGVVGALLAAACIIRGFYFYRKTKVPEPHLETARDGESQLPYQSQGASDGDNNANAGGGVSTGDTTMEGGIDLGSSTIRAPVSIGTTTINFVYQILKKTRGGASIGNTPTPEVVHQSGTELSEVADQL